MAAVSQGNGALELIALGNDGKLYHWRYQDSTWTGPVLVGIGIISAPALVYALGEQNFAAVAIRDGRVFINRFADGRWTGFQPVIGQTPEMLLRSPILLPALAAHGG